MSTIPTMMRLDRAPVSMTADERSAEITSILARGVLRYVLTASKESGQKALTGVRPQSDECATRTAGSQQ